MRNKSILYLCGVVITILLFSQGGNAMEITSKNFKHNQSIPTLHTCDGKDLSPNLAWSGAPEGTKSFALTCIDPDAPVGDFIHWLVYNIPATVSEIPQAGPLPAGFQEVENDFGKRPYGGPCPPSGTHRYFFTVYALKVKDLGTVSKSDFLKKVKENQIASAEIIGLYQRK
ncbi:MAG: YbhB/YbcL family Raf kinase inhibitor-like protein [Deltaproteobacteria bacterium]|nr:YbhB/YbcL family Raf kinase inhibitor-like protein [Deltaproteobacteria bacterium]